VGLKGREFGTDGEIHGQVALEYVWEVGYDILTICGGFVGSPANFKGKSSDDHDTITGRWEWPGGGYEATMSRLKSK
jgi:hypothetical protein